MREDVWATFYHLLSTNSNPRHRLCPQDSETWCKSIKSQEKKENYDHTQHFHLPEVVMNETKPIFSALSKPELLQKCLRGKSKNPNESLNNVIWARVPKRTFVRLDTLKFGVYEAVLSFNDGYISKILLFEQLGLKVGQNMVTAMKRLDIGRVRKCERAASELEKKSYKTQLQLRGNWKICMKSMKIQTTQITLQGTIKGRPISHIMLRYRFFSVFRKFVFSKV